MDKENMNDTAEHSELAHHKVTYTVGVKIFLGILLMISIYLMYLLGEIALNS